MRCYDCIHWRKGICTERLGECRVDGPGIRHDENMGRWPVTKSDWGCSRYIEKGETRYISFEELISNIKEDIK